MDKKIEKMANIITGCDKVNPEYCVGHSCEGCHAYRLYKEGYRRQEDVARKIFADILGCLRYTQFMNDISKKSTIAYINELKKKYGVTDDGKTD